MCGESGVGRQFRGIVNRRSINVAEADRVTLKLRWEGSYVYHLHYVKASTYFRKVNTRDQR